MHISAHATQETDTQATIDVTVIYNPTSQAEDLRKLYRVTIDKITGRCTVFHEGTAKSTPMSFSNIEDRAEQEEGAILAAIYFPSGA